MFFTYVFTGILLIALILQLAVDQAPDLVDSNDDKAARRVVIAGLLIVFIWMARYCFLGIEGNSIPMFGVGLIALAEVSFCTNRLFPEFGTAIKRTALIRRHRRQERAQ